MAAETLTSALLWVAAPSFLLGSIPVGLLVGRAFGVGDVRNVGSGNIGATNVLRAGGKAAGAATLALDVAKGAIPALLAGAWLGPVGAGVAGLAAFLGHCYSPFLKFDGGKGVASGLGALLAWRPEIALLSVLLFAAVVWRTRYVSLASLAASFLAVGVYVLMGSWNRDVAILAPFVLAMALVSAWRHRANIGRLLRGEESKIGGSAPPQAPGSTGAQDADAPAGDGRAP
ncbi:MAG: glycerol-3-phosphate 1-O-acyltransferase PlsY [Pseudomonadota bacterium]